MKLRNIKNLPVFDEQTAQVVGQVEKAVIGDDYKLAYIVIVTDDMEPKMILRENLRLTEESVVINNIDSIKSYAYGEELSIYENKLGDTVFDREGRELGVVSDFIISGADAKITGFEVSGGAINDILNGRREISIKEALWKSKDSLVVEEGSDS